MIKITHESDLGLLIAESDLHEDYRGSFTEAYKKKEWMEAGFPDVEFVQTCVSLSRMGTVRGMHYQTARSPMGKLVRCLDGCVCDVVVDVRYKSPTFGKYAKIKLSRHNNKAVWVPPGFAHGFVTVTDNAIVHYQCSGYFDAKEERQLAWNCPYVNIDWGHPVLFISDKDKAALGLENVQPYSGDSK